MATDSTAAPDAARSYPPDFTVAYGDDPEQIVDVRLPAGARERPLVIYVHGGFWKAEWDRTHADAVVAALALLGYATASVEYRRVGQPGGGWPGTLEDVQLAIAELPQLVAVAIAERGGLPIDATRPILVGHSAGGQLVLWVGHRLGRAGTRGVVALAPVAGLTAGYHQGLGGGAIARLLGGGPADVPDRYAAADPTANLPLGVPVIVVHGELDEDVPVTFGDRFAERARDAGDDVEMRRLPGVGHMALVDPSSAAWTHVTDAVDALSGPTAD
jgi:acetyl esterase/lipase